MGSQIKAYVSKLEIGTKGVFILLSRTHYGFLKRLLEIEIPEINDGTVILYSVAREAGSRSKIAVYTEEENIEPIGCVIGNGGNRINRVLKQIGNEKIDVVNHVWGNDRIIINPSFSEEGLKEVSCLYCNYKKEVTLAKSKFLFMLSNVESYYTLIGLASEENNLDIVIPSTYNDLPVKKIGDKAFQNCQNVNSVIVPDSVTEIGRNAFEYCSLLKKKESHI